MITKRVFKIELDSIEMVFDDLWGWKRGEKMRHGTAHVNSKRGL